MASTTFSGPVTSTNGFVGALTGNVTATTLAAATAKLTVIALASLPAAAAGNAGTIYYVSGTSSGNTLVFSDGTANIDLVTGVAVIA
jgi:hypothetical protein